MNLSAWRYFLQFYKGSYRTILLTIFASGGQAAVLLAITLLVRYIFDVLIHGRYFSQLTLIGAAIFLLYLTDIGLALWIRHAVLKTTREAIKKFRIRMLEKFYAFSRTYYSKADLSKLHTLSIYGTRHVSNMSNVLVSHMIPGLFICVVLSAVLLKMSWLLLLVWAGVTPFTYLIIKSLGKRVRQRISAYNRTFETFSKGVLFVLQNMDLTRVQTAEKYELERQSGYADDELTVGSSMSWLQNAYALAQSSIIALSGVVLLIVGAAAVSAGHLTLGKVLSFYVAVALMKNYVLAVLQAIPQIIEGNEALNRLYGLLNLEETNPYSGVKKIDFKGKVVLDDISFHYDEKAVLENVSLDINPGETAAIVGPNGAGKSTITHLIMGFYRPQKGELRADDRSYETLDITDLRRQIGVVMQDPVIFSGTIFENIAYGLSEAAQERVIEAAKISTAEEFISRLPEGYAAFVGEGGILLSGGQRQRIAIARALARQPKLLILDEPTNHLDGVSVKRLISNLKNLDDAPAMLIISHDMDIVRDAGKIYVLQNGSIAASSNFEELLSAGEPGK